MSNILIENLLVEVNKLHERLERSKIIRDDFFEPGQMEWLDKSEGIYEENTGELLLRFESKGTRYDGRTEYIEYVNINDRIIVKRDKKNQYNSNNFVLLTSGFRDVGNMPAELCNVIAPLYDAGRLTITESKVSFVEPISKRSRHAKQAVLFVEMKCIIK